MAVLDELGVERGAVVRHLDVPRIPLALGGEDGERQPAELLLANQREGQDQQCTERTAIVEVVPTQGDSTPIHRGYSFYDRILGIGVAELQLSRTHIGIVQAEPPAICCPQPGVPFTPEGSRGYAGIAKEVTVARAGIAGGVGQGELMVAGGCVAEGGGGEKLSARAEEVPQAAAQAPLAIFACDA